jgi:uncharacterized protein YkwD
VLQVPAIAVPALLALGPPLVPQIASRCPVWGDAGLARLEARLVEQVNRRRQRLGRGLLARDPRLDAVAREHALEMARRQRLGHRGRGSSTPTQRLRAGDVRDWSSNAENLGRASTARSRAQLEDGRFPSADCHDADSLGVEIEAGWATSPGHREAMLDGDFTHVGSGAAWDAGRHAVKHNFPLHSLSTDLHSGSIKGPVFSYGRTMAKLLHLGFTVPEMVKASTLGPAELIDQGRELGSLSAGTVADITLFRVVDQKTKLTDSLRNSETGDRDVQPVHCIRAGKVFSEMKIPPAT